MTPNPHTEEDAPMSDYAWRVTRSTEGEVSIEIGDWPKDMNLSNDTKLHLLGRSLIKFGTTLMGSTIGDDDDDD